jgi:hypothetical protein
MRDFPLKTQMCLPAGGIYCNATHMEAQMCDSEEVIVVGGGKHRQPGCGVSLPHEHVMAQQDCKRYLDQNYAELHWSSVRAKRHIPE